VTTDPATLTDQVESPCIQVCTLDAQQICVGCGRSLAEIAAWSRMSAQEKRAVILIAEQRKKGVSG
jgi:predicted Fe-S protein YdhL (DUF1289 family)